MAQTINMVELKPVDIKTSEVLNIFDDIILETFPPQNKLKGLSYQRVIKRYTPESLKLFEKLNSPENKRDIYFTPNGRLALQDENSFPENNNIQANQPKKGELYRGKSQCTDYQWLVFDIDVEDNPTKASQQIIDYIYFLSNSNPTLITNTKRGYHIYYKLEEPEVFFDSSSNDRYSQIYGMVVNRFKDDYKKIIDPATKDVSRLFRVPNSLYWKGGSDGAIKTNVLYINKTNTLNFESLYKNMLSEYSQFSSTDYKEKTPVKIQNMGEWDLNRNEFVEKANQLPIIDVVRGLGYKVVNGTIYQNGEPTDGWRVWTNKNIVNDFSHKKDRPGGNPFEFAMMHFGGKQIDTFKFFQSNFGMNAEHLINNGKKIIDVVFAEKTVEEDDKFIPILEISEADLGCIRMDYENNCIYFSKPQSPEILATNFSINLIGKVKRDGKTQIVVQFQNEKHKSRALLLPDTSSPQTFNRLIRKEGVFVVHTSSNHFFSLLLMWIEQNLPQLNNINLINHIGFLDNGDFIGGNEILTAKNDVIAIDPNTRLVGNNIIDFNNFAESSEINIGAIEEDSGIDFLRGSDKRYSETLANQILDDIGSVYNPDKSIPVFLAMINSLLSDFYYKNKRPSSHIIIWGESQSGKTATLTFLKKLIGFKKTAGADMKSITRFPFYVRLACGLPFHISEYNNTSALSDDIQVTAKSVYDRNTTERGTTQQKINTYKFKSSVIFEGEYMPSEEAIQNRSIISFFRLNDKIQLAGDYYKYTDGIIKKHYGFINYFFSRFRKYHHNSADFFVEVETARADLLNELYNATHKTKNDFDIDIDRILEGYAQLLVIIKTITDNEVVYKKYLGHVFNSFIELINVNKSYSSLNKHFEGVLQPIYNICNKKQGMLRGVFKADYLRNTLSIQKIPLSTAFNNDKMKNAFNVSATFLSQHGVIENDSFIIKFDFCNPKLKNYEDVIVSLLYSLFYSEALSPYSGENIQTSIEMLINPNYNKF